MSDYCIDLRNVTHRYGSKVVLSGVNLRVRPGDFLSIVGPSGCGKSTLFRLILGEERASAGIVLVDGKPKDGPGPEVGIVYQRHTVFPHLTALQNVAFGPLVRNTSIPQRMFWRFSSHHRKVVREAVERAREYLEIVDLADAANRYPEELSGGMQQRVAIAQALVMDPKIILMDEPFGSLDTFTREVLQQDILRLWERIKMTILFVTHDLEEAVFIGRRIAVLSQHFKTDDPLHNGGSRIVMDVPIPFPSPRGPELKESAELNAIMERVRRNPALRALKDEKVLHEREFLYEHPDSVSMLGTNHAGS